MQHITTVSPRQEPAERENLIFPRGLIGFSEAQEFSIQFVKGVFKLCCVDDPSLSFLALPIEDHTTVLEPCDIEQVSHACNVPEDEMMILLLITARQDANSLRLTCNLRAPLVVHKQTRQATQHVFAHNKYDMRYEIGHYPLGKID